MKILPNDPVIVSAVRTPIGKYGGILKSIRPDDMLASVIDETLQRVNLDPTLVNEVVAGCANQAGEDNRNVARMAILLSRLPDEVPGITLNRLCASGLDAVIDAARRIIIGEHTVVCAGGVESMTRAPWVMAKADRPFMNGVPSMFDTALGWRFFNENMRERTPPEPNGMTAEHLVDRYQLSRQAQDRFAFDSHMKAVHAIENGWFDEEILPLTSVNGQINIDEGPRKDTSMEKLATLKSAFKENGSVTPGNSSSLNDGASALLLTSYQFAKTHQLVPMARIIGFKSAGVDPRVMGIGPVFSTNKLLSDLGLSINDFDAIEINEAFAAQVLAVQQELKIPSEKLNPLGGAIALGHPLGCSGARILTTLVHYLQKRNLRFGLASLCVGVGQGVSIAVEAM